MAGASRLASWFAWTPTADSASPGQETARYGNDTMKTLGTLLGLVGGTHQQRRNVRVVAWMFVALAMLVVLYSATFHLLMALEGRDYTWTTSFYWTLVTMSTLGFGDITFESDIGRVFSVVVLLSGIMFLLVLLPFSLIQFIFSPWMDQREASRTPRSVPDDLAGHIVVTRLDPVSQALIARAKRSNIPHVVLVDDATAAAAVRDAGYQVMIGALDEPRTYLRAGVERASLVASTQSDTINTNIAFTVREADPDVKIVVTADSPASIDVLELAGADNVIQLASGLGTAMARRVLGTTGRTHTVGHFGPTRIAEAGVRGTPLVGSRVEDLAIGGEAGPILLAISDHGVPEVPDPKSVMTEDTMLIFAGSDAELATYDRQLSAQHGTEESPVLILGGGRVGRSAAEVLASSGVPCTIIEKSQVPLPSKFTVIRGDAAELENLKAAGLATASAVLVTTHDDDVNIYLTLYCRRLKPGIQVMARATHERNVTTLYRAGADGVLSYAAIGATAIWNTLGSDQRVVLIEGLELVLVPAPPPLMGRSVHDPDVIGMTGCDIVALTDDSGAILKDTHVISDDPGLRLMIMGDRHAERKFRDLYLNGKR